MRAEARQKFLDEYFEQLAAEAREKINLTPLLDK